MLAYIGLLQCPNVSFIFFLLFDCRLIYPLNTNLLNAVCSELYFFLLQRTLSHTALTKTSWYGKSITMCNVLLGNHISMASTVWSIPFQGKPAKSSILCIARLYWNLTCWCTVRPQRLRNCWKVEYVGRRITDWLYVDSYCIKTEHYYNDYIF